MKASYQPSGLLIVVSGPSGVGKGTVCRKLREYNPNLTYSISATTRSPRKGEEDGVNYYFKSHGEFEQMIANGELIEWAEYNGNYYGTPRHFVEESLRHGKDVLLEIEVEGAKQVKETFSEGVFIFLVPPTFEDLRKRIIGRGSETPQSLANRLQIASRELDQIGIYHYAVINDEVERAATRIDAIISAEHCRTDRILLEHETKGGETIDVISSDRRLDGESR
jgi:guanylate kinase